MEWVDNFSLESYHVGTAPLIPVLGLFCLCVGRLLWWDYQSRRWECMALYCSTLYLCISWRCSSSVQSTCAFTSLFFPWSPICRIFVQTLWFALPIPYGCLSSLFYFFMLFWLDLHLFLFFLLKQILTVEVCDFLLFPLFFDTVVMVVEPSATNHIRDIAIETFHKNIFAWLWSWSCEPNQNGLLTECL